MRLRSGLTLGPDEAERTNMEDSPSSTRVERGTPLTSFSTTDSQGPTSPVLPPPAAGPSGSGNQLSGQHYYQADPETQQNFILFPNRGDVQYADGRAPQEQTHNQAPYYPLVPSSYNPPQQPAHGFSSYTGDLQQHLVQHNDHSSAHFSYNGSGNAYPPPLQPLQPQRPVQQVIYQPLPEAVQQWPDPAPWSPIQGAQANVHSLVGIRTFPPDRTYPDKIEEELDELSELEKGTDTDSDEDEEQRRRRRSRRGKKRRRHRSTSRDKDRDKRGRGGSSSGGHRVRV